MKNAVYQLRLIRQLPPQLRHRNHQKSPLMCQHLDHRQTLRRHPLLPPPSTRRQAQQPGQRQLKLSPIIGAALNVTTRGRRGWLQTTSSAIAGVLFPTAVPSRALFTISGCRRSFANSPVMMPVIPIPVTYVVHQLRLQHRFLRHFQLLTRRKRRSVSHIQATVGQISLVLTPMLAARPGGIVDTVRSGVAPAAKAGIAWIATMAFDSSEVAMHFWPIT